MGRRRLDMVITIYDHSLGKCTFTLAKPLKVTGDDIISIADGLGKMLEAFKTEFEEPLDGDETIDLELITKAMARLSVDEDGEYYEPVGLRTLRKKAHKEWKANKSRRTNLGKKFRKV